MGKKTTFLMMLIIIISSVCSLNLLQAQTINSFPYSNNFQSANDLTGWTVSDAEIYCDSYDDSYMLKFNSIGAYITSPILDLSSLKQPTLTIIKDYFDVNIYTSTDGIQFTKTNNDFGPMSNYNNSTVSIDKNTKHIKIVFEDEPTSTYTYITYLRNLTIYDPAIPMAVTVLGNRRYLGTDKFYDFNGDGIKEIYHYGKNQLEIHKPQSGDFVFDEVIMTFDESYSDIKLGHFNNDGIPDFTCNSYYDSSIFQSKAPKSYSLLKGMQPRQWDVNNDGLIDLYSQARKTKPYQSFLHFQQADGSFLKQPVDTISEAYNISNEWTAGSYNPFGGKFVLPGKGFSIVYAGGAPKFSTSGYTLELDLNNDNLPDLIDEETGEVLINCGNGKFIAGLTSGDIISLRDLNGDFVDDFILWNTDNSMNAIVYKGNGEYEIQTLFSNIQADNVYCHDFDKDGDIDILFTINYTHQRQFSLLVFCENLGDGTFRTHENVFMEKWIFKVLGDLDNDGYYDIIAKRYDHNPYDTHVAPEVYLFRGQGITVKEPELFFLDFQGRTYSSVDKNREFFIIDIDDDGRNDILSMYDREGRGEAQILYNKGTFDINHAPAKPNKPTISLDKVNGKLHISWLKGNDRESSAADLTYSLRIGSAPGKGDMYYADSNADGSLRSFKEGNMAHNLKKTLNITGWVPGNYYIAVQAIDPSFKGSAWSDETVFTNDLLKADFTLSETYLSPYKDTLQIALTGKALTGYNYNWELADGNIIKSNGDNSVFSVLFPSHGKKSISLQITDDKGRISEKVIKEVEVAKNAFAQKDYHDIIEMIDLNGNGSMDIIMRDGMYQNDGSGNMTKVGRLYNMNFTINRINFLDFDMDGLPDIVAETNKGDVMINQGDYNFNVKTENLDEDLVYYGKFIDLNNDGFPDILETSGPGYRKLYKNMGDNKNFEQIETDIKYNDSEVFFKDMNNDGLKDIIIRKYEDGYVLKVYLNQGDFTFADPVSLGPKNYSRVIAIEDMDNDGYPDLITSLYDGRTCIFWGDKEYNYNNSLIIEGTYDDNFDIHDYDNNGYLDLATDVIYYFYPDRTYKMQDVKCMYDKIYPQPGYFVDLNGDKVPDMSGGEYNTTVCNYSYITNTTPEAPQNIRARQTEKEIVIEWDPAKDKETPHTQMRYNVSVKKKGKTGAGSFIISPMNGLKNEAAIIPTYRDYVNGTRFFIPIERMPEGEYEIQIQSIDLWNAQSVFSAPFTFRTESQLSINLPAETCMNEEVTALYVGNESGTCSWDWDGATVVSGSAKGPYNLKWDTDGVKEIKVTVNGKTASAFIKVHPLKNLEFTLPVVIFEGYTATFDLPEDVRQPDVQYYFNKSDHNISIGINDNKATVIFPSAGTDQWIELVAEENLCEAQQYRCVVDIRETLAAPQITLVTADAESGKNKILWNKDSDIFNQEVTELRIYKEGTRYNQFELLATVNPAQGYYIDQTSNPEITTSRYCITYNTIYDIKSKSSAPHRSTHLLLNKGIGNAINLLWSEYQGGIIDSYRIYRGAAPESLSLLTKVAGSVNSYTDAAPLIGTCYYAIEYDQLYNPSQRSEKTKKVQETVTGRSNAVSISDAQNITLAETLNILAAESAIKLDPNQDELHLYAEILPFAAEYQTVRWQIMEGTNIATIDSKGLLKANGVNNGSVRVRATTIDGSNLQNELVVEASGFALKYIEVSSPSVELNSQGTADQLQVYSNTAWVVTTESSWLNITPGSGSGNDFIYISSTRNKTGYRSATIKIASEGVEPVYVIVSQRSTTGTESMISEDLLIYPNPFAEGFYIKNITESVELIILNIDGRIMMRKNAVNNEFISLHNLEKGIYIIKIRQKDQIIKRKVIKI